MGFCDCSTGSNPLSRDLLVIFSLFFLFAQLWLEYCAAGPSVRGQDYVWPFGDFRLPLPRSFGPVGSDANPRLGFPPVCGPQVSPYESEAHSRSVRVHQPATHAPVSSTWTLIAPASTLLFGWIGHGRFAENLALHQENRDLQNLKH